MLLHVAIASRLALLHFLSQQQHDELIECHAGTLQCSICRLRLRHVVLRVRGSLNTTQSSGAACRVSRYNAACCGQ